LSQCDVTEDQSQRRDISSAACVATGVGSVPRAALGGIVGSGKPGWWKVRAMATAVPAVILDEPTRVESIF
jgi:hypothetical protein